MTRSGSKTSDLARHLIIPKGIVSSDWPRVRRLARQLLGIEYDQWQDGLGMLMLGKRADGKYAASIAGVIMSICRQAGKTMLVGSMTFILCIIFPGLKVIWTAHRSRTSDETFAFMKGMAGRRKARIYIRNIRSANGQQELEFTNGSRILFGARERGFGRGFDNVGLVICDEAQILTESALDDMVPSMNTATNPLLIMMGTPPKPGDPSEVFANRRDEALGDGDDMLYVEFSADRGCDPQDHDQWAKANPSYPRRTPASSILRLLKQLDPDSFRREALGIWDENAQHAAIEWERWDMLAVDKRQAGGTVSIGLDMPPDRSSLAIGACMRYEDGTAHIELARFKDTKTYGIGWAADWTGERWKRLASVVIDAQSPATVLIPELKKQGVRVTLTSASSMGQAVGRVQDMLRDGTLHHLRGQAPLDMSVQGCTLRPIGHEGAYGWNKAGSDVDISPLVAVTLALHGAFTSKRQPGATGRMIRLP
ncbi:terminase [Bifidobacterium sp.]|uniref:terminase n=1 Tax=Bifidobacterium sp. TaxID=41200 RepID=UPI0039E7A334